MATAEDFYAQNKIPDNLRMLQRVMVKLKEDMQNPNESYGGTYMERAVRYTGLQTKVLEGLQNAAECQVNEFNEIDRGVIYEELASFYLKEKIIPSTKQLFEALYDKIPPYVDIRSFRKTLVKMGFVWKRKNNTDTACVVIEKPTIIFERYEYLKNIIKYRNEKKNIYFIDENAFTSNGEYLTQKQSKALLKSDPEISQQRVIYAVSKKGVHSIKFIDSFDEDTFTEWLIYDLLLTIENSSILVFNNSKHHCERIIQPPNKESLKIEICNWLKYHNITFKSDMSKYELLDLTQNFTDVDKNMYKIDETVKEHGHIVLRIPDCINKLTPANLVCNLIKENKGVFIQKDTDEDTLAEAVYGIPLGIFYKYNDYTAEHEKDIYTKDVEMDKIFDDLLKNMATLPTTNDEDTDIPSCSDSE